MLDNLRRSSLSTISVFRYISIGQSSSFRRICLLPPHFHPKPAAERVMLSTKPHEVARRHTKNVSIRVISPSFPASCGSHGCFLIDAPRFSATLLMLQENRPVPQ